MSNSASFTSGISGRYATALFELARDAKQLDAVEGDLSALGAALAASDDLQALISSPIYSRDVQGQAIAAVAKAMKLSKLTASTLGLMATKRRLFVLPQMLAAVQGLIAEARGEVTAEVTVARKLSKEQSTALAKALKSAIGKDVIIKTEVDDRLIGGMIVKLGSRMIDTSIRAKLSKLQNTMKEVG